MAIKKDELKFWKEIWRIKNEGKRPYFREIAESLKIHSNRAYYIVCKWEAKGLTDSGINSLAGWINEGVEEGDLNEKRRT